jgi:hypothetical protein
MKCPRPGCGGESESIDRERVVLSSVAVSDSALTQAVRTTRVYRCACCANVFHVVTSATERIETLTLGVKPFVRTSARYREALKA